MKFSFPCTVFLAALNGQAQASFDFLSETEKNLLEDFRRAFMHEPERTFSQGKYAGRRRLQGGALEKSGFLLADYFGGRPGFYHSVASGDPLKDAVIIWTRYTPVSEDEEIDLEFRMAEVDPDLPFQAHLDPDANPNMIRGVVKVTKDSDFVAKIDVTGLKGNTHYVFVFSDGTQASDVGKTRTAPGPSDNVEEFRYAVFSCSNFPNGYFHAYDIASTIENLDLMIHVGDWLEYGYFGTSGPRLDPIQPRWEIVDLQDYRLRHATYVHGDEGTRNLRRSVPMMASWDDHETTNNAWEGGAENHQPVCPANRTSPIEDINRAGCDQNEGDWGLRVNAAFQAYMEWLPIRYQEGTMGLINGSFTQVIEWGKLATLITFDTRISYRAQANTEGSAINAMVPFAFAFPNVTKYEIPGSPENVALKQAAEQTKVFLSDPSHVMIGDYINDLETYLGKSADSGKPWQIWAANTMFGNWRIANPYLVAEYVESPEGKEAVRQYLNTFLQTQAGLTGRILYAMAIEGVEVNPDEFSGVPAERRAVAQLARSRFNNLVVLGGDVHDSYSWQIYREGNQTGTPVAVSLICPGVTSDGIGAFQEGLFNDEISRVIGDVGLAINLAAELTNEGLVYSNYQDKGFYAVSVTPEKHVAEYFLYTIETRGKDFETARAESGGLTAEYFCGVSLETRAGEKGSLDRSDTCSAISFTNERSALFDLPVPITPIPNTEALTDCDFTQCTLYAKCDDDRYARFFVAGKEEPCVWLAARMDQFGSLCNGEAGDICRETCGTCFDDCEDTSGYFTYKGVLRNCLWLSLRNHVIDEPGVCDPGSEAAMVCPETCDICDYTN